MSVKLKWDDKALVASINKASAEALVEVGDDLLEKSQEICPKDDEDLVDSSSVEFDAESLSVRVKYDADHALIQHERQDYKHKSGERAKFLEGPLNGNAKRYLDIVTKKVKAAIGRK